MKSSYFSFKQFDIAQDRCAMKVGTDGVLLGAWVEVEKYMKKALDIGSGTAVMSLMLAQRFPFLEIAGIEIDANAVSQSRENIKQSPWDDSINIVHGKIQDFVGEKYDVIISNPPFFSTNTEALGEQRTIARHEKTLSFVELFQHAARLLSDTGVFSLIFPTDRQEEVNRIAQENLLYCHRKTIVYPNPNKKSKRVLQAFSFVPCYNCQEHSLTIETDQRHEYTKPYKALLKGFYLKF